MLITAHNHAIMKRNYYIIYLISKLLSLDEYTLKTKLLHIFNCYYNANNVQTSNQFTCHNLVVAFLPEKATVVILLTTN